MLEYNREYLALRISNGYFAIAIVKGQPQAGFELWRAWGSDKENIGTKDLTIELFEIVRAGVFVVIQWYNLFRCSRLGGRLSNLLLLLPLVLLLAIGYFVKRLVRLTESMLLSLVQRLVGLLSSAVVNFLMAATGALIAFVLPGRSATDQGFQLSDHIVHRLGLST